MKKIINRELPYTIKVYIDGFCDYNHPRGKGKCAIGYVIDRIKDRCPISDSEVIGEAEDMRKSIAIYTALNRVLEMIKRKMDTERIVIQSDSRPFIKQMDEEWKVKDENAKRLFTRAKVLAHGIDITYRKISAKENTKAHNLARECTIWARDEYFKFQHQTKEEEANDRSMD